MPVDHAAALAENARKYLVRADFDSGVTPDLSGNVIYIVS